MTKTERANLRQWSEGSIKWAAITNGANTFLEKRVIEALDYIDTLEQRIETFLKLWEHDGRTVNLDIFEAIESLRDAIEEESEP